MEYKKTSDGANRDFKAITSKLPGGRNRWDIIGSESSAGFLAWEKSGQEENHPSRSKVEYVCWPRTEAGRQKKISAKQNNMTICSDFFSLILVIPKHHLFSLKCLCLREKTKIKKVKSDKKRIVCGFISKNIILKRVWPRGKGKRWPAAGDKALRISGRVATKG